MFWPIKSCSTGPSAAEPMEKITVALGERSYDVLIDDGLLDRAAKFLAPLARDGRLLVVSDETVWAALGSRLDAGLGAIEAVPILVAPGEESKSWAGLRSVVDALLDRGVERTDHILAFGGGVIGDLAGLAAAVVNRGCNFVQVPTSLLAQVDSSVGGKTGINVAAGKNLVGAFHQPSLVLVDPSLLDTLDARQVRAGYAEIVKYALIEDPELFDWLERHGPEVLNGDPAARMHAIAAAVAGKARIVGQDERETSGRRALLVHLPRQDACCAILPRDVLRPPRPVRPGVAVEHPLIAQRRGDPHLGQQVDERASMLARDAAPQGRQRLGVIADAAPFEQSAELADQ